MRIGRVWQDAGRERRLDPGDCYDLPDVVAQALIATRAADAETPPDRPVEDLSRSPETKPAPPFETGRRRAKATPTGQE